MLSKYVAQQVVLTHNCFMIHVDDLLFTGSSKFWAATFLPTVTAKFNVSHNELKGDGRGFISEKTIG